MKLSVIMACLNSEKTIAHAIESFLEQRYPDKELIVVDGASSDGSVKIAQSFKSGAIRVVSEKDRGIYDAMNKGFRLFSGDAVGFLGSDDTFHGVESLDSLAEALSRADVVYGDLHIVADHVTKRIVRTYKTGPYRSRSFQRGWMPPHTTFYLRRHVVEKVGAFDTRYRIGADYDYTLRVMALNHFRTEYIPKTLIDFQYGGTSSKSLAAVLLQNWECLDSRRRHLGASPIDAAFFLKWGRGVRQLHWW